MTPTTHLVVGAGPVGTAIARELVAAGHTVRLASRSGSGPAVDGAERVAVDAADADALTRLAAGAAVVYNAVNPPKYHTWPTVWPPIAAAILAAAERSGAVLATISNLYAYGRVTAPMTEQTPLDPADDKGQVRLRMWLDALAAHEAGRVRAVEVRGSDYLGAGAYSTGTLLLEGLVAGKAARAIGDPDAPHSWTHPTDSARLLVAVAADASAHGRAWHTPTAPPRSPRQLVADAASVAGLPPVKVSATPTWLLRALGTFNPTLGAVAKSAYQFEAPFVIDDSAARSRYGLGHTPWKDTLMETVTHLQASTSKASAR